MGTIKLTTKRQLDAADRESGIALLVLIEPQPEKWGLQRGDPRRKATPQEVAEAMALLDLDDLKRHGIVVRDVTIGKVKRPGDMLAMPGEDALHYQFWLIHERWAHLQKWGNPRPMFYGPSKGGQINSARLDLAQRLEAAALAVDDMFTEDLEELLREAAAALRGSK